MKRWLVLLMTVSVGSCGSGTGGSDEPEQVPGEPADQCLTVMCTTNDDCDSGYHCNMAVDTGQADRGKCQELGCGPEGSVCSEDAQCTNDLLCNDHYGKGVEEQCKDEELDYCPPTAPRCQPGYEAELCHYDSDCREGLFCNDNYTPPQCQDGEEWDLCTSKSDCRQSSKEDPLTCNLAGAPCFFGDVAGCDEDSHDADRKGVCASPGGEYDSCLEDKDCSDDDWPKLRCVHAGDEGNSTTKIWGHGRCLQPGGYGSRDDCHSNSACPEGEYCIPTKGQCGQGASAGSPCVNFTECRPGNLCEEGVCD